ncbi:MAG: hypothetical protein K5694_04720 [Bacilli bacterium]|nr:hypothetical protein [Bacilli bacterium]
MQDWGVKTLFWILTFVVLVYIIFFIFVLHQVIYFSSRMNNKLKTFRIMFAEKKEILLSLYSLYQGAKIPLTSEDEDLATKVRWINPDKLKIEDISQTKNDLNAFQRKLAFIAERESYIKQSEDLQRYLLTLSDIEKSYHRVAAAYNNDLAGFTYWRTRAIYRWIFFIFRVKMKDRIV